MELLDAVVSAIAGGKELIAELGDCGWHSGATPLIIFIYIYSWMFEVCLKTAQLGQALSRHAVQLNSDLIPSIPSRILCGNRASGGSFSTIVVKPAMSEKNILMTRDDRISQSETLTKIQVPGLVNVDILHSYGKWPIEIDGSPMKNGEFPICSI